MGNLIEKCAVRRRTKYQHCHKFNIDEIFASCSLEEIACQKDSVRGSQEKGREKFYVHLMYRLRWPDRWITIIPVAGVVKYRDHACLKPILGRTCRYALSSTTHVASVRGHAITTYSYVKCGKGATVSAGMRFLLLEFSNIQNLVLPRNPRTRQATAFVRKRSGIYLPTQCFQNPFL